jgi:hypothetical protein
VVENFTANAVSVAIGDNENSLVLYVTWRPFVFSNQFDLNLFMITTTNSSILYLLAKESMLLTSVIFLIEKRSSLMLNDIQITSDYMSR